MGYSPSQLTLTAACGRPGRSSDSPPGCHSLLRLRFAYPLRGGQDFRLAAMDFAEQNPRAGTLARPYDYFIDTLK